VLVARHGAAAMARPMLRAEFVALLKRAGALPQPPRAGTMPTASSPTHCAPDPSGR
jgi:ribonuclease P protein component